MRHETKKQKTWNRYDKGHRKAEILSSAFLALLLLPRFLLKLPRVPEPHGSAWRTEVLPTVKGGLVKKHLSKLCINKSEVRRWVAFEGAEAHITVTQGSFFGLFFARTQPSKYLMARQPKCKYHIPLQGGGPSELDDSQPNLCLWKDFITHFPGIYL